METAFIVQPNLVYLARGEVYEVLSPIFVGPPERGVPRSVVFIPNRNTEFFRAQILPLEANLTVNGMRTGDLRNTLNFWRPDDESLTFRGVNVGVGALKLGGADAVGSPVLIVRGITKPSAVAWKVFVVRPEMVLFADGEAEPVRPIRG